MQAGGIEGQVLSAGKTSNPGNDFGELAQLGERLLCKQEVTGSSPVFSIGRQSEGGGRGCYGIDDRRSV